MFTTCFTCQTCSFSFYNMFSVSAVYSFKDKRIENAVSCLLILFYEFVFSSLLVFRETEVDFPICAP